VILRQLSNIMLLPDKIGRSNLDAACPIHQQSNMLNFIPRLRPILHSRVTSKVFVSVTIGIGDFIHSSNAIARLVSCGLISCFILLHLIILMSSMAAKLQISERNTKLNLSISWSIIERSSTVHIFLQKKTRKTFLLSEKVRTFAMWFWKESMWKLRQSLDQLCESWGRASTFARKGSLSRD